MTSAYFRDDLAKDFLDSVEHRGYRSVSALLKLGVNVNTTTPDGRTALHIAAGAARFDVVHLLLQYGADKTILDSNHKSARDLAFERTADSATLHALAFEEDPSDHDHHGYPPTMKAFIIFFAIFECVVVALHCIFTRYGEGAEFGTHDDRVTSSYYGMFTDVHVMIFVGFGYLMTFLRKYCYGSTGFTLLVACVSIQWYLLVSPFWWCVMKGKWEKGGHFTGVELKRLTEADFSAGAVLITFGAVIGKVSPLQLCLLAIWEISCYALNESIALYKFYVTDVGGSMTIHMFGAFFGLSATLFLSPKSKKVRENVDFAAVYHSDMFAMIGTVFLWVFWPSFNATISASPSGQHRAIVNTLLGLTGSTIAAFCISPWLREGRKFDMADIQNATLSAGVALGAAADLYVEPGVALFIGVGIGSLSTFGFSKIQPFLQRTIGLHDTCGINNLHGMPSIVGAVVNIIVCRLATPELYKEDFELIFARRFETGRTASVQAWYQLAFVGTTLAISIGGGLIGGFILSRPIFMVDTSYTDKAWWHCPPEETPYYFTPDAPVQESLDNRLKILENKFAELRKRDIVELRPVYVVPNGVPVPMVRGPYL